MPHVTFHGLVVIGMLYNGPVEVGHVSLHGRGGVGAPLGLANTDRVALLCLAGVERRQHNVQAQVGHVTHRGRVGVCSFSGWRQTIASFDPSWFGGYWLTGPTRDDCYGGVPLASYSPTYSLMSVQLTLFGWKNSPNQSVEPWPAHI